MLVLTCVPGASGSVSTAPCSDLNGVPHVVALVEYSRPVAVSFAEANEFFSYGFFPIIGFYAIGATIGAILSLIKRGG